MQKKAHFFSSPLLFLFDCLFVCHSTVGDSFDVAATCNLPCFILFLIFSSCTRGVGARERLSVKGNGV